MMPPAPTIPMPPPDIEKRGGWPKLAGVTSALQAGRRSLRSAFASLWQDGLIVAGAGCTVKGVDMLAGDGWAVLAGGLWLIAFGWIFSPVAS